MSNYIADELQIRPDISSVKPESGLRLPPANQTKPQDVSIHQGLCPRYLGDTNVYVDKREPNDKERKRVHKMGGKIWVTPKVYEETKRYAKSGRVPAFYMNIDRRTGDISGCISKFELSKDLVNPLNEMIVEHSQTIPVRDLRDNYLDPADIETIAYATYLNILGKSTEIESGDRLLLDTWKLVKDDLKSNFNAIAELVMHNPEKNTYVVEEDGVIA